MVTVGVYKITNTKNGKIYIGQSTDIEKRFKQHICLLRKNEHNNYLLQDDWNIYGEDAFEFSILRKCISFDLDYYEKEYIKDYNSTDKFCGYNLSKGNGIDLSKPHRTIRNGKIYYSSYYDTHDNSFFRDNKRQIRYAELCEACCKDCKQSFRAEILSCPLYAESQ